jgi:hypothetical protein
MSISPAKNWTASASDDTAITSISSTTAASVALAVGTTTPFSGLPWSPHSRFCRAAAIAIESAPRVGRVEPSSDSSPTTA